MSLLPEMFSDMRNSHGLNSEWKHPASLQIKAQGLEAWASVALRFTSPGTLPHFPVITMALPHSTCCLLLLGTASLEQKPAAMVPEVPTLHQPSRGSRSGCRISKTLWASHRGRRTTSTCKQSPDPTVQDGMLTFHLQRSKSHFSR